MQPSPMPLMGWGGLRVWPSRALGDYVPPPTFVLDWLSYQRGLSYMALFVASAMALVIVLAPALYDLRAKMLQPRIRFLLMAVARSRP